MYKISIKHNNIIIFDRVLSETECKEVGGIGVEFIFNAFNKYFSFDIGSYRLDEYKYGEGFFIINIRSEDLIELRNNKLEKLGL